MFIPMRLNRKLRLKPPFGTSRRVLRIRRYSARAGHDMLEYDPFDVFGARGTVTTRDGGAPAAGGRGILPNCLNKKKVNK